MTTKLNSALLIAGPTASGKSDIAIELAMRLGGVIVNADSMQVYRDLRILTARPSLEDEAKVAHRLYGFVPAATRYSVGRWVSDIVPVLRDIEADGKVPIIVGGTGLYFRALLEGLSPVPPTMIGTFPSASISRFAYSYCAPEPGG